MGLFNVVIIYFYFPYPFFIIGFRENNIKSHLLDECPKISHLTDPYIIWFLADTVQSIFAKFYDITHKIIVPPHIPMFPYIVEIMYLCMFCPLTRWNIHIAIARTFDDI